MSLFVYGQVADDLGHLSYDDGTIRVIPHTRYASEQPGHILVDARHDGDELGRVLCLRREHRTLDAVCQLDRLTPQAARLLTGNCWFSAYLAINRDNTVRLEALSLTDSPGSVGLAPIRVATDLTASTTNPLLQAAAIEHRSWRRSDTLTIIDPDDTPPATRSAHRSDTRRFVIVEEGGRPERLEVYHSAPYNGVLSVS